MHARYFHFLSIVTDRLQDGPVACPQLRNVIESAAHVLLKFYTGIPFLINEKSNLNIFDVENIAADLFRQT